MSANQAVLGQLAWNRDELAPGAEQDAVIKGITGEVADKGSWSRTWTRWSTGRGRAACGP